MKKFQENLNTAVLTSSYVISGVSPIVTITHHEDGIWEFFGKEKVSEENIIVVSLGQMIQIDPSIHAAADLPINFQANREFVGQPWAINAIAKT